MHRPDVDPYSEGRRRRRWIAAASLALLTAVALSAPTAAVALGGSAEAGATAAGAASSSSSTSPGGDAPIGSVSSAPATSSIVPTTSAPDAPVSPTAEPALSTAAAQPAPADPTSPTADEAPSTASSDPVPAEPAPTEPPLSQPVGGTSTSGVPVELAALDVANLDVPLAVPFAATASGRVVIAAGHVDMGPRIVDGQWRIQIRDDTSAAPVWRNLEDVVLHGADAARMTVPPGSSTAFLGAAGSTIWLLPQVQQANIVWPGWNTQDASVTSGTTGGVTWTLAGVDGPGDLVLFLTGSFGASTVLFDSTDAFAQSMVIDPNTHVHGNWAFTQPGIYRLSVTMSATSTSGTTLTDSQVLTFAIGAVDPATAFSPTTTTSSTTSSTTTTTAAAVTSTSTTVRPASAAPTTTIAHTGANVAVPTALGAVSIALGAAALGIARRRPTPSEVR